MPGREKDAAGGTPVAEFEPMDASNINIAPENAHDLDSTLAAGTDAAGWQGGVPAVDEQRLFESARACVQQHLAASVPAGTLIGTSPRLRFCASAALGRPAAASRAREDAGQRQEYPEASATHAEVLADAALFQHTLHALYAALGIKISKVMRLGGQELNLHLLYQRVRPASHAATASGVPRC